MKLKRLLKILIGILIFFTLPSFLLFGFVYLRYNETLPEGQRGQQADEIAMRMLSALDHEAYKSTDYLEWSFKGMHHYKWYKTDGVCEVSWDDCTVVLDLKDQSSSKVFFLNNEYNGIEKQDYVAKALSYFNNDSFWLVAPYKVFDKGTERRLITTDKGKKALLVTYTTGGSTPGDSYLWHFDETGRPVRFQMWVSILPIDGLEATWEDWVITESGARLPTFHKLLFLGLEMGDVKGLNLN